LLLRLYVASQPYILSLSRKTSCRILTGPVQCGAMWEHGVWSPHTLLPYVPPYGDRGEVLSSFSRSLQRHIPTATFLQKSLHAWDVGLPPFYKAASYGLGVEMCIFSI